VIAYKSIAVDLSLYIQLGIVVRFIEIKVSTPLFIVACFTKN